MTSKHVRAQRELRVATTRVPRKYCPSQCVSPVRVLSTFILLCTSHDHTGFLPALMPNVQWPNTHVPERSCSQLVCVTETARSSLLQQQQDGRVLAMLPSCAKSSLRHPNNPRNASAESARLLRRRTVKARMAKAREVRATDVAECHT